MMQVIGQRLTVVWPFECELWGKLWISLLVGFRKASDILLLYTTAAMLKSATCFSDSFLLQVSELSANFFAESLKLATSLRHVDASVATPCAGAMPREREKMLVRRRKY